MNNTTELTRVKYIKNFTNVCNLDDVKNIILDSIGVYGLKDGVIQEECEFCIWKMNGSLSVQPIALVDNQCCDSYMLVADRVVNAIIMKKNSGDYAYYTEER